jgi:hypothetical protein
MARTYHIDSVQLAAETCCDGVFPLITNDGLLSELEFWKDVRSIFLAARKIPDKFGVQRPNRLVDERRNIPYAAMSETSSNC